MHVNVPSRNNCFEIVNFTVLHYALINVLVSVFVSSSKITYLDFLAVRVTQIKINIFYTFVVAIFFH